MLVSENFLRLLFRKHPSFIRKYHLQIWFAIVTILYHVLVVCFSCPGAVLFLAKYALSWLMLWQSLLVPYFWILYIVLLILATVLVFHLCLHVCTALHIQNYSSLFFIVQYIYVVMYFNSYIYLLPPHAQTSRHLVRCWELPYPESTLFLILIMKLCLRLSDFW